MTPSKSSFLEWKFAFRVCAIVYGEENLIQEFISKKYYELEDGKKMIPELLELNINQEIKNKLMANCL